MSSTGTDDLTQRLNARPAPEREGLPQSYRMRADAHYVDQLESPRPPVIRLLPTGQIVCLDLPPADRVEALAKSIVVHGVLQPLMIRKHGAQYILITGRKRLAAAMAAGLSGVPCLVHEIDGTAAAAMASADNLRLDAAVPPAEPTLTHAVMNALSSDLSTILTSTALLVSRGIGGLPPRVSAGLIEAQAARAAWMVSATLGTFRGTRQLPLGAIIQGVSDSFAAHVTLSGLELECTVTPSAAVWKLPEEAVTAALTGAVLAALSYLEGAERPRVEVHADAARARSLNIEVVQRDARVSPGAALSADQVTSSVELIPALALRLAKQVATACGGNAELSALPGSGSVLQLTFPAPLGTVGSSAAG